MTRLSKESASHQDKTASNSTLALSDTDNARLVRCRMSRERSLLNRRTESGSFIPLLAHITSVKNAMRGI